MNDQVTRPAVGPLLDKIGSGMEKIQFLSGTDYAVEVEAALAGSQRLFLSKIRMELESAQPPPRVVIFVGGTNVGKSTMFNLFLGEVLAGPAETAGATKCAVVLVSETDRPAVDDPAFLPGYHKELLTEIEKANELHDKPTAFITTRPGPFPWILIDSPDVDSRVIENAGVGQDLLWTADSVFFVTSDQKYLDRLPLQFFKDARDLRKELIVVFNKMEEEEKGRVISEDFCHQAGVKPDEITRVVMPYEPGLAPGSAAESRIEDVREALMRDPEPLKRRTLAGAATFLQGHLEPVMQAYLDECGQIERIRERLEEIATDRKREFERYARNLAANEFYELKNAIHNIAEEYRIPLVDDFLARVRESAYEMWKVVRRQFSKSDDKPPIEQRRQASFDEAYRQVDSAGRAFRQHLRNRQEEGDLIRVVYERMTDLEELDKQSMQDAYLQASSDREEFTGRIEEKIRSWLEDHPSKRYWLQTFKLILRGSVGALVAGLTGGFGPDDLIWGPLAAVGSELVVKHMTPPNFFKVFKERFVQLEMQAFDAVLERGYTASHGERLPESDGGAVIETLRRDLTDLAKQLESNV